jgi:hypothetical protein
MSKSLDPDIQPCRGKFKGREVHFRSERWQTVFVDAPLETGKLRRFRREEHKVVTLYNKDGSPINADKDVEVIGMYREPTTEDLERLKDSDWQEGDRATVLDPTNFTPFELVREEVLDV